MHDAPPELWAVSLGVVPYADALALAEPGGCIRVFVDEGPPMAALLNAIAKERDAGSYARRLLGDPQRVAARRRDPAHPSGRRGKTRHHHG